MKTLICGMGEIGGSLYNILSKHYETRCIDTIREYNLIGKDFKVEIMHICFPYSEDFIKEVKRYKKLYKPKYVVIHSTIPVGTSRKCKAIHSPVEGIHPQLEESIQTFTKFLGGKDADKVADYFRRANMRVYITDQSETTEYMKIMSTTFYGMMIEFTKQVKSDCRKLDIPFEMFTLWNINYNESYEKLGHQEYKKPLLVPIMNKIGAHCVLPNTKLLKNDFTDFLKNRNKC